MTYGLKHKVAYGMLWSSIERFLAQGMNFALGLVIARLLSPSDYGIIAMLGVFLAVSGAFIDSGFSAALIRKLDRTESDNSTVFYFNMIIATVAYLISCLLASDLAEFFNIPILAQITPIASLILIFNSLCIVQQTVLTIRIDFKTQAKVSIVSVAISGILGIVVAYLGYGVWALVIQMVFASIIRGVMLWMCVRWWPVMSFSTDSFRTLFSFGSKLLSSSLVVILNQNFHTLVLSKVFSQNELGMYSRANQTAAFPAANFVFIMQRVTFPVLSTIQNDEARLRENYLKLIRIVTWLTFPLMALLFILSKPLVLTILTDKWSAIIEPLQILCIALSLWPVFALSVNMLTVQGRSGYVLNIELLKTALNIGILFITYPLGLIWVCWGQVAVSIISLFVYCYHTTKSLRVGFGIQLWNMVPNMIMAVFASVAAYVSIVNIDTYLIQILVGAFVFLAVYVFASYRYNREAGLIIASSIKSFLSK